MGMTARQGGGAVCGAVVLAALAVLASSALWILVRPLLTTTLRIGTDGVVIERLFRRRFIPRATLTSAGARDDRLVLWRTNSAPVSVRTSSRTEAAAVAQRIREAAAVHGEGAPGNATLSRLDRQGRSVAEWLRDARSLGDKGGGYRDAALDRRELLDVVEDGSAPAERRIAAAAALSYATRDGEDEVRARVRSAAETCADPRLRVAIESANTGEVEETRIEEAMRATREG
jgi:hypothetical protein